MSETQPIRVLIADDQELVRAGFAMVIDSQDDMEVVGQASNGAEAVTLSLDLKPDVVLMDVRMPGTDGIEATKLIIDAERKTDSIDATTKVSDSNTKNGENRANNITTSASDSLAETAIPSRKTHVIILTTFDLDEYVMSAIDAGASGFLLKDTEPETLLSSIRTVYQGNAIIAPSATKRLIEKMVDGELGATRAAAKGSENTVNGGNAQNTGNLNNASIHHNGSLGNTNNADYSNTINNSNTASSTDYDNSNVQVPRQAANNAQIPQPNNGNAPLPYHDPAVDTLTDREREVLVEIAHGLSNQEIADKLCISLPTVKTHVAHILQKTYSRDRVQAVVFAYDNKLV
ncbi:response regulator transcription factor [Bifidobacterium sp. ESL0728]|uniref:response regulator transcription factor n=1 Tax=Bifidobacterium sp. ESL0728 TaxID=2983220 RepID=UPI0023F9CD53|nr:response regulator transcription factor [Bifidobacterium sp. ESL0728]WEV59629.1 response regulator transcription factor [Bifidobacterium sp. ESL0728]